MTAGSSETSDGSVIALWRYPVKSMIGEDLDAADVTDRGLIGDRAYALVDRSDGKVASAKNPRKWPGLFNFRAAITDIPSPIPSPAAVSPRVRITLPDGATIESTESEVDRILSQALDREVMLDAAEHGRQESGASAAPTAEAYWPDMEGLNHRDTVTNFELPEGTFFDTAVVHLVTTATLERLRELYPEGCFDARRFRPNMLIETVNGAAGFVEDAWIGRNVAIGDEVRLRITRSCTRCVMTTLPQGDLPRDLGILRTAARNNSAKVGVYAAVIQGGRIRRGDPIRLES